MLRFVILTPSQWQLVLGAAGIVGALGLLGEGVSRLIRRLGKRAGIRETTLIFARDAIRAIWILIAVVGVAFYTKLASDLTVVAVSTVGGLIVSLALQATLSNVIAGLYMLEDGTLRVGDQVTYSGQSGKVVRMTLRTSWIMNDKGGITVVSNSNLMGGPLTNHTATTRLVAKYHLEEEVPPQKPPKTVPDKASEKPIETTPGKSEGKVLEDPLRKGSDKESERDGS
ncbi:MAG: mechanosensitive ion channel family protein [Thermoplasmata archaeon]